jgi:transposase-like protein
MDQEIRQFRAAAARENRGRRGVQRRYSPGLRAQAVRYWGVRRQAGAALPEVAEALGVAPWSLHLWTQRAPSRVRFAPVHVVAASPAAPPLAVVLSASGPRVEGLTIETAARLLVLLR